MSALSRHTLTWPALVLAIALALPAVARADRISPDWVPKWRADLAFAADSLPHAHPNFFHAVRRETYRAALDSLSERVPSLEHHQIVVELARILALVHDGHTRLSFPFDSAAGFFSGHSKTATPKVPGLVFRHYPVRFGLFADTLFVIRADSSHRELLGGRVVTLGAMTAAEAMAAVEPTVQRDNEAQVRDLLPTWLVCPEILHARGVIAEMEHAPIVVERDGAHVSGSLTPVPPATSIHWIEARDPGPPPLRERHPLRRHWFTAIHGTHTVYACYREVLDDPKESVAEFADSLFAAIERSHADRLVLDLRGNVGGDGSRNRPLVQHLIRAQRLWRPGGLWALIDRGTFSAAVMLTADLEMRTPMLLVGEMTGGHPNSYGDSRRVMLPNSGVTVRVSSLFWQLTGPQDPREGITPHVPVTMHFNDWRTNHDPALDVTLGRYIAATSCAGSWSGEIGFQSARLPLRLDLVQKGTKWEGRVNLPDAQLTDAPLSEVRAVGKGIAARWMTGNDAWTLSALPAGERVVGLVHYHGLDFPVVLQRSPTR